MAFWATICVCLGMSLTASDFVERRHRLVRRLCGEGIAHEGVLAAIEGTPRHLFVGEEMLSHAYENRALPIGEGQTISQPFIVALMTSMLLGGGDRIGKVLEIGTGCGYQAAVLARLADKVFTVERIPALQDRARAILEELGVDNVEFLAGDGFEGWPAHQPYDGIMVTAAPDEVPQKLLGQLGEGGRLVIPWATKYQQLRLFSRTASGIEESGGLAVRFVPMLHGVED